MAADGSIVIEARVDDQQAQATLKELENRVKQITKEQAAAQKDLAAAEQAHVKAGEALAAQKDKLLQREQEVNRLISERERLEGESLTKGAGLDEEKAKLTQMRDILADMRNLPKSDPARNGIQAYAVEVTEQRQRVQMLQREYDGINRQIDAMPGKIDAANAKLAQQAAIVREAEESVRRASMAEDTARDTLEGVNAALADAQAEAGRMAADGSIIIEANIDDAQAQSKLSNLQTRIDQLNAKIMKAEAARMPLLQQAEELTVKLDEAKAKLDQMQNAPAGSYSAEQIVEQSDTVKSLQHQWDAIQNSVARYSLEINASTSELHAAEAEAGRLSAQLAGAGGAGEDAGNRTGNAFAAAGAAASGALEEIRRRVDRLGTRITGLIKRVFFFTLITSALRNVRSYISDAIKMNDEAAAAFGRLEAAFETLAQPILQILIPALTTLANVLTTVITALASFFSMLGGSTLKASIDSAKALNEERKALKGTGAAAKTAKNQLASFDEINKLTEQSASGAGAGTKGTEIEPLFDDLETEPPRILKQILDDILAIAAGLLAWKIASHFIDDLKKLAGIAMAVAGAIMFLLNLLDAWNNGVDWGNLAGMLAGLALAATGLYLAFGPLAAGIALIVGGLALLAVSLRDMWKNGLTWQNIIGAVAGLGAVAGGLYLTLGSLAAGISLVVGGLAFLVIGFQDAIKNGMNWRNTLLMIAGILAAGLGISLITGSWIPLLIAGIASALLALVQFAGNGDALIGGLVEAFDGLGKFLVGVFTGDWEAAMDGLRQAGEGFKKAWDAIVDSIKYAWNAFTGWIKQKGREAWESVKKVWSVAAGWFRATVVEPLRKTFKPFFDWWGQLFKGVWLIVQAAWKIASPWFQSAVINPIKNFFTTAWNTIADFGKRAWENIKNAFSGAASWFTSRVIDPVRNGFKNLVNTVIGWVENGVNAIIRGINGFLSGFNAVASLAGKVVGKDYSGVASLGTVSIPRLAQGAVIPPNREFMAVLGDQHSGTNIETPLETMIQAFRTALDEYGGSTSPIILRIDLDGMTLAQQTYRNLTAMQRMGLVK